jgi:hypothetical protein
MRGMTPEDYQQLVDVLDGRIDKLTKPIPSKQILRFAEAIRSAELGDEDSVGTYTDEDYSNLLEAREIVDELLPAILESIRVNSISPVTGWRFDVVSAGDGDYGLCSICRDPYQHFKQTVKVHCIDMHRDAFHGVCRECVRQCAPLEFVESNGVEAWLDLNPDICERIEEDEQREGQRVDLIDAVRRHALSTHYFGDIVQAASKWAKRAFGEWR